MADIHPRLTSDCVLIGRFPLCHLLLSDDSNYPWFILVPDRDDIQEVFELERRDREQLLQESCLLAEFIMRTYRGDKLNLAALGNQVPQLHLHHIVRYVTDPAWPGPIWGKVAAIPYTANGLADVRAKFNSTELPGFEPADQSLIGKHPAP